MEGFFPSLPASLAAKMSAALWVFWSEDLGGYSLSWWSFGGWTRRFVRPPELSIVVAGWWGSAGSSESPAIDPSARSVRRWAVILPLMLKL